MVKERKDGISVLLPTQNSEKTVELSIRSFLDFADEIIAVDNGSHDRTVQIVSDLAKKIDKLTFFNVPELPDLYHNRQYAFEQSQYNWICRFDSDHIANTSGPYDIKKLRKKILSTERSFWPVSFGFRKIICLVHDFWHTGPPTAGDKKHYVPPVITRSRNRIYQYFPGMKFGRLGRWEGVQGQIFLRHTFLEDPYIFHCEFKMDRDHFFRSERTNWRQLGNYKRFPTLESYIQSILEKKYGTRDMEEACRKYMKHHFWPYVMEYDPDKYCPYPQIIEQEMKKRMNYNE